MDLMGFADPWEHVRLLSDRARNDALLALLRRRAPGARVVEVGAGSGLWSCVAAQLGAEKVYAVEPTPLWRDAAALVEANGLGGVVEIVPGRVQDVARRDVDLAFSELLNADPFAEQVLDAMDGVAPWVVPGGLLAPRRLRVWVAAARAGDLAREARGALAEVDRLCLGVGLDPAPLRAMMGRAGSYGYGSANEAPAGPPVIAWDLGLGLGARPEPVELDLVVADPGPVGGVVVWFEAELDDGIVHTNAPGGEDHWGRRVLAWPAERGVRGGGVVRVRAHVEGHALRVEAL